MEQESEPHQSKLSHHRATRESAPQMSSKQAERLASEPCRRSGLHWRFVTPLAVGLSLGWLAATGCVSDKKGLDVPLMMQAWNTIQRHYVDQSAVKPTQVTYGAIQGMMDALGDTGHSAFLTPGMVKSLEAVQSGKLKGIGVEIQLKDGKVVVVAPLDNSPAQKAGLRPGDTILEVDDQDISGWPLARVVESITGPEGSEVRLALLEQASGRTREVTVTRAVIKLHEVSWQFLPGTTIVHLRIASFDGGVTRELRKALIEIKRQAAKAIILDLRDDPGGLLDEAVGVTSQFLTNGNVLLSKNARGDIVPVPVEKGGVAPNIPLVVLINGGTASAAEIVAGALQDAHRATLVGQTTFGTGTVLQQFRLSDGSALLLAVEEWLTPHGDSFWHKGIAPKITVALPAQTTPLLPQTLRDMTEEQLQSSKDSQLLAAMKLVGRSLKTEKDSLPLKQSGP